MKKMRYLLMFAICGVVCVGGMGACRPQDSTSVTEEKDSTQVLLEDTDLTPEGQTDINDNADIVCQWDNVIIHLPKNWKDAYLTFEDDDSIDFYQKASYEVYEGMGQLFSIYKSKEWLNFGAGETMLAYTDDGMMYYMIQPTDVPADTENEASLNEYITMVEQVPQICADIEIEAEGIRRDASQHQIPISSVMLIEQDALANFTDNQLWIARNEIYARHGRMFKNTYLQSYFNSCSWYQPIEGKTDVTDEELSEIERANLETIVAAEVVLTEQYPYPKAYALDEVAEEHLEGSPVLNSITYRVEAKGDEFTYVLTIDGEKYDLSEYISMVSPVADVFYITNLAAIPNEYGIDEDGLEIAVLDEGPSNDPVTHFFKYDGELYYLGCVAGFPFEEYNNGISGFSHQNGVYGTVRMDLIETCYLTGYWWYDSSAGELVYQGDNSWHSYQSFNPHDVLVDLPLYQQADETSLTETVAAHETVYFLQSDMKEWIYVRSKGGVAGYIRIEDGNIENVGMSADEVFTNLNFFD